ncbi:hypothetical protein QUF72_12725 [Desulfobacterales bacterium HSG2]|nr:hypothetical protein [Desulfobacterales bacterium HSG2]
MHSRGRRIWQSAESVRTVSWSPDLAIRREREIGYWSPDLAIRRERENCFVVAGFSNPSRA